MAKLGVLRPTVEGCAILLEALEDIKDDDADRWVADKKIAGLLSDIVAGDKEIDARTWLNLTNVVKYSTPWTTSIHRRHYRMPNPIEAFKQVQGVVYRKP